MAPTRAAYFLSHLRIRNRGFSRAQGITSSMLTVARGLCEAHRCSTPCILAVPVWTRDRLLGKYQQYVERKRQRRQHSKRLRRPFHRVLRAA